MRSEPLTVGQLIDLLGEVEDKSLPIYSEGCDCIELAYTIDEYGGERNQGILIERKMVTHPPRKPLPTLEELEQAGTLTEDQHRMGIDVAPEASISDDAPSAAVVPSEGTKVEDIHPADRQPSRWPRLRRRQV